MMRTTRVGATLAVLLLGALSAVRAADGGEAYTVEAHEKFLLDEYNVDVQGGSDSARIAAGLTFGTGYGSGWWWNVGARLAWERWQVDVPTQKGGGVGGTFGGGYRPERAVSPFASIALDRTFGLDPAPDWIATVNAGARVRVTPNPREHFTMTFALFQASGFGGGGTNGSNIGFAVLYSAAFQAKMR